MYARNTKLEFKELSKQQDEFLYESGDGEQNEEDDAKQENGGAEI